MSYKSKYLEEISEIVNVPRFKVFNSFDTFNILELKGNYFAVRSSAEDEDTKGESKAGLYDSFLYVPTDKVQQRVQELLRTCSEVIVQEMVEADFSGVCLTKKELYKETYCLAHGLCEAITNGETSTSIYYRDNDKIRIVEIKQQKQRVFNGKEGTILIESTKDSLTKDEMFFITKEVEKLQNKYNYPLDIEFSIKNNVFYCLQCRPLNI